jgi:LysM repeat protein
MLTIAIVFGIGAAPAQAQNIKQQRSLLKASISALMGQPMPPLRACGASYVVRSGDTLSAIARRCGVTVSGLMRWNGLRSDRIRVGQVLSIPAQAAPAAKKRIVKPGILPAATPKPLPRANPPIAPTPTPSIESTVSPWQ